MNETKVVCPFCEQDWLTVVHLVALNCEVVLCPECDALWLSKDQVGAETSQDYGTFMQNHGRKEPQDPAELRLIGYLLKSAQ